MGKKKLKEFMGVGLTLPLGLGVTSTVASGLNVQNPAAQGYSIAGAIPTVLAGGMLMGEASKLGKMKETKRLF